MIPSIPIVGGIAAAVIIGALWVDGRGLNKRVGELTELYQTQKSETEEALKANLSCTDTVTDLETALSMLIEERRADQARAEAEIAERDERIAQATREASEQRRLRNDLWNRTQSCAGLAQLRVGAACPELAERVRERTTRPGSD